MMEKETIDFLDDLPDCQDDLNIRKEKFDITKEYRPYKDLQEMMKDKCGFSVDNDQLYKHLLDSRDFAVTHNGETSCLASINPEKNMVLPNDGRNEWVSLGRLLFAYRWADGERCGVCIENDKTDALPNDLPLWCKEFIESTKGRYSLLQSYGRLYVKKLLELHGGIDAKTIGFVLETTCPEEIEKCKCTNVIKTIRHTMPGFSQEDIKSMLEYRGFAQNTIEYALNEVGK